MIIIFRNLQDVIPHKSKRLKTLFSLLRQFEYLGILADRLSPLAETGIDHNFFSCYNEYNFGLSFYIGNYNI